MEQLVESLSDVINERRGYATQVQQSYKQEADDEMTEVETEDVMMAQIRQNEWVICGNVRDSRLEPLLEYCSLKDFCGRLSSVNTNDEKVLEMKLWFVCWNIESMVTESYLNWIDFAISRSIKCSKPIVVLLCPNSLDF